jgi:hypothetical protein
MRTRNEEDMCEGGEQAGKNRGMWQEEQGKMNSNTTVRKRKDSSEKRRGEDREQIIGKKD